MWQTCWCSRAKNTLWAQSWQFRTRGLWWCRRQTSSHAGVGGEHLHEDERYWISKPGGFWTHQRPALLVFDVQRSLLGLRNVPGGWQSSSRRLAAIRRLALGRWWWRRLPRSLQSSSHSTRGDIVLSIQAKVRQGHTEDVLVRKLECFADTAVPGNRVVDGRGQRTRKTH